MTSSLADARAVARRLGLDRLLRSERVPLGLAAGRTLSEPVMALIDVPSADVSAMDGWAVSGDGPWTLDGSVRMGDAPGDRLDTGHARAITTGGAVPPGTSAVLRAERCSTRDGLLFAESAPVHGADIRRTGEELRHGDLVVAAGRRATPAVLAAVAVAGHDVVTVRRRPTAAVIVLGDEVVATGEPRAGQVRDAFGVPLPALLAAEGVDTVRVDHARDDVDAVTQALQAAAEVADLVVTTGGTSHGRGDHLVDAIGAIGGQVHVRGVDARPGRPTVLAALGNVPLVGLPGNPFAATAAFVGVGLPLVAGLLGSDSMQPVPRTAALPIEGCRSGVRLVAVRETDDGIAPVVRQQAGMATALVDADALAIVDGPGVRAGDVVRVLALPWR